MALFRKISGTWRSTVGGAVWRNISGTWKRCNVYRNISGVWKQVASMQTLTPSPSNFVSNSGMPPISSQCDITASVSATFTFTLLSGSATGVTFGSSSGTSTYVRISSSGGSGFRTADYRVTDTITGVFIDIHVDVDWSP